MIVDFQDSKRINMLKFLMEIYPHGDFVSVISTKLSKKFKRQRGTTTDPVLLANFVASKLEYERDYHRCIDVVLKKNEETHHEEEYVIITDIGKQQIWEYAQHLYQESPFDYIKWLLDWVERGDPLSIQQYENLLDQEVVEYVDLLASIVTPIPFDFAIQNVFVMRGLDFDTEEEMKEFVNEMLGFLERAIMLGIAYRDVKVEKKKNSQGQIVNHEIEMYQLTTNGVSIIQDVYKRLRATAMEDNKAQYLIKKNQSKEDDFDWKPVVVTILSLVICFFIAVGTATINPNALLWGPIISIMVWYIWNPIKKFIQKIKNS